MSWFYFFSECGSVRDEVNRTVEPGAMCALVLDVSDRPIALCGGIVALVEEQVEGLQHESLFCVGWFWP